MPKNKGFTLIELLVVIAIIGILSSVVLASLNTARVKARDTRRVADIKSIQLALEFYYDAKNAYPVTIAGLVGSGNGQSLAKEPVDPQSGAIYTYAYKGASPAITAYHVAATLEQLQGATTLDDGDLDLNTTGAAGWTGGFSGFDTTTVIYDASNVGAP